MEILIKGAKENNLNEDYIEELKSITTFKTPSFKKVIAMGFYSPLILLFMFIVVITAILKNVCGFKNVSTSSFFLNLILIFWMIERKLLVNILGSGGKLN